jgi:hypothetical protein
MRGRAVKSACRRHVYPVGIQAVRGRSDKPLFGRQRRPESTVISTHSAAVVLTELGGDFVQSKHLFVELDIVLEIAGAAELVQDINELLLLAQELLLELLTCLLTCLLR